MDATTVKDSKTPQGSMFAAGMALSAALSKPQASPYPEGQSFVFVPKADGGLDLIFLERPEKPARVTGAVVAYDADSFCGYILRHLAEERATVYARIAPAGFVCVLNDHATGDDPGWRDHRVAFALEHSDEYKVWAARNREPMSQREFVEFIEDQLHDFTSPSGARMYEIATNFKVKNNVNFKSAINTANGQVDFQYVENVEGAGGTTGKIGMPEEFAIEIPVWRGLDQKAYTFEGRLRYKLANGTLTFTYALDRPVHVVEQAFAELLEGIKDRLTGTEGRKVHILFGDPGR